ncbi:hypothetical protein VNO78_02612 [Psophocarpus tetragonolobus]|uniref:XS domain-containing protein n=1 Tax=Psophocarpus tetragonolobus TaxID=3891 RepID=A0AAN9XUU8_PSOTE
MASKGPRSKIDHETKAKRQSSRPKVTKRGVVSYKIFRHNLTCLLGTKLVWPYEETDEYDFVQGIFGMMHALFSRDSKIPSFAQSRVSPENQRNSELWMFNLFYSLSSYLYFLVTKKSPEITDLRHNELSRQEVDEIINMCVRHDSVSSSDNIQKRTAVVEFNKNWTDLDNALAFEREYEMDMGKKDWFANTELKFGIYAWIARAEDYKMNNIIGEQLQKMDVITISQLTEVEARMQDKLLSNLNNTLQNKRKRLKDMEVKYNETSYSMDIVMGEIDKLTQDHNQVVKGSSQLLLICLHCYSFQCTEDEDMMYMFNAYLHKLITCFLSNPLARDKIKESKERIMSVLSPYHVAGSHDFAQDNNSSSLHDTEMESLSFNSILDFVSEVYQKEPELLSGNDVLWTFVNFAGEDHTNFQTLVAFLNMLSTLACSQEGASKVYELLQGKAFRSIGWSTLFECLTIYDEKFKQSLQTAGAMLPEIQEGDAKAFVAYLNVLKKVVENGNSTERKTWFPDIEPLFKLLSSENVPPYLKGALRNAIATFIHVSPVLKDSIWTYLEQYDLPVVVGPDIQNSPQSMAGQPKHFQSSRMVGLVQLLLKSNASNNLIEDYAACLQLRPEEFQNLENNNDDPGTLIMQVILDILDKFSKPDANALLHEFGFQHLDTIGIALLPKWNSNQSLHNSSLHQRAWLLKLLAVELHAGDVRSSNHREACQTIFSFLFAHGMNDIDASENTSIRTVNKSKEKDHICKPGTGSISLVDWVSERGAMVGTFKGQGCHDHPVKQGKDIPTDDQEYWNCWKSSSLDGQIPLLSSQILWLKTYLEIQEIGVYYYSERGHQLIDLASFHDKLWQKYNSVYDQASNLGSEVELNNVFETIQQLLRWGWKYNKNLEEQATQLHMLTAWSQIVETDLKSFLVRSLMASLSASASPDCSLKMAFILSQVALTCMAKLRDERFLCPGSLSSDNITCLDLIVVKQLSNGACLTILFKLTMEILRNESSEALRRRQYALLLSYFQYCQNVVDPDVPTTILQFLLLTEQDNEYIDLLKVIKDATHGSEPGKTISLYVIDALISIDHECYFLNQHQSRGFLRSCFTAISNICNQDGILSLDSLQRACTFEAEFALLLRISHKYGKSRAQVLFSRGMLEYLASGRAINLQVKNKIFREVIDFVKRHPSLFDQVLRLDIAEADELRMEQINLVVGILSKVWPYEETDEYGFVQGLFGMMHALFSRDSKIPSFAQSRVSPENQTNSELRMFNLCYSLSSYLYFLVTKKSLRLQPSDSSSSYTSSVELQQPTLSLLNSLFSSVTAALERAAEEKSLLLNKIRDINELSRQEVDEIINMCPAGICFIFR